MRKLAVAAGMIVLASCSGQGEVIPTPAPAPEVPSTAEGIKSTVLVAAEEPEPTTTEVAPTSTEPATTIPPRSTTTAYLQPQTTTRPSNQLANIRACESGGNYSADTGNGYYGAYQFSWGTWASVGGSGNPALASPAEQDMRAQMMINSGRRGEWPNC